MNNDGGTPPQPITSVLNAAQSFTNRLQAADQASLVTFATHAQVRAGLTSDVRSVANRIAALTIDPEEERGSTNTGQGILQAGDVLSGTQQNPEARKVLVLLTDGLATTPDANPEAFALRAAQTVKNSGVIIYTIGLGAEVNMEFLRQIASTPGQAYAAPSTGDLERIYRAITAALCEDGPAVIEIIPKTTAGFEGV